ncbi:sortase [Patescibacteria group bacterium]|nr:sortase [Patescibacteria group bacterium]
MIYSKAYRKIFLIRFAGYFFTLVGLVTIVLILEPVVGLELQYNYDQILGKRFVVPNVITSSGSASPSSTQDSTNTPVGFAGITGSQTDIIKPVSTDFGIVIEKIGANAKVIPNVDPANEKDYTAALAQGVAHAKGTAFPGQDGNIYLFSHSTDAPWNVVRYNAIFFLLNKLDIGDRIIMFYQGKRYDYIVFDKTIAKPSDTHFLTDQYNKSVLTLQTCDPPGTLVNRLIVRAKLAGE